MSDQSSQQAAPDDGAASPRVDEAAVKLRYYLADWNARNDALVQNEEAPDAGWVIESAEELLAALDAARAACMIRTAEHLDALPVGTAVRVAHGEIMYRAAGGWTAGDYVVWPRPGWFPALLLWHPDWEAS